MGPERAFAIVEGAAPSLLFARQEKAVPLVLRNEGTRAWLPGERVSLSYHWLDRSGATVVFEGARTAIPGEVPPGAEVRVEARLRAPDSVGGHRLRWEMVEEGVCWFSNGSAPPSPVLVLPGPLDGRALFLAALLLAVLAWRVGRAGAPLAGARLLSVADLAWLSFSLAAKQEAVLREARRAAGAGAAWAVAAGVAGVGLALLALPRRARPLAAWAAAAAASLLLLADIVYLRFFGDLLSLAALGAAGQAGEVSASIFALLSASDAWLFADLLPGAALVLAVRRLQPRAGRLPAWAATALLAVLLLPGARIGWRLAHARGGALVQVFQNVQVVEAVGALNFHAWDLGSALRTRLVRPRLDEREEARVEGWLRGRASYRAGRGPTFGLARGRNLVMLQVESLQSFVVGLRVEGQEVTPNLNRLRGEALLFSHCADQTAQGRTSDAELTTQASLLPPVSGAAAFRFGGNRYAGLAEALSEGGYSTLSAVPFRSDFWNRRLTHRAYGYGQSIFEPDFAPGPRIGWGLNDRDFLAQMAARLEGHPEPFAAYLMPLSNHHPFDSFPAERRELRLGRLEGTPLGNYLQAMRYFDSALGAFLARLEADGLLGRSLIALWGDHASGLPWNTELARFVGGPATGVEARLRESVPFLVLAPGAGRAGSGELGVACGQLDIAPTLFALLGFDPTPLPWLGRNLLGMPGRGPVVLRHGCWRGERTLKCEGACVDLRSREALPEGACADLERTAAEMREVSALILSHDLQAALRERLRAPR